MAAIGRMYDAGMLQKLRLTVIAPVCLLVLMAARAVSQGEIRYHFGDDLHWAAAGLNDNDWMRASDGRVPFPGGSTDGFMWLRARVTVSGDAKQFALRMGGSDTGPDVQQIFVNGVEMAKVGEFPPEPSPVFVENNLVVALPAGTAHAGQSVDVAIRGWVNPLRRMKRTRTLDFTIAPVELQRAVAGEARAKQLLSYVPQLAIGLLLGALGVCVLALGLWSARRVLFLCALWLVTMPLFLWSISALELLQNVHELWVWIAFSTVNAMGMAIVVEFIWELQGYGEKRFKHLAHACWILLLMAEIGATLSLTDAPLAIGLDRFGAATLLVYNLVTIGASFWAVLGFGRNRAIAVAMVLINIGYFFRIAGHPGRVAWLQTDYFGAAFFISSIVIAALLIQENWELWKQSDGLRIEFAAARELQQQLVPVKLPEIEGLRLEAAYLPAAEVGGDFYQVLERRDGGTFVLVGDVSGKGLKAAMTGVLTIGAARAIALDAGGPAEFLTRLNHEVAQGQSGGFVTCACAQISCEGDVTLANAGHLAPYCNGKEVAVEAGLPLGIVPEAEYEEKRLTLQAGDALTFMSDGVVEAQNQQGELFGFARTEAIAQGGAEEIAHAALTFGQADDITVLKLRYTPVGAVQTA